MTDEALIRIPRIGAPKSEPREKPGPLEYMRHWPLRVIVGATLLFLYLPLITLMVFSFNDSRRNIVWQGFTTDWYVKAFNNESLLQAFVNSLTIAQENIRASESTIRDADIAAEMVGFTRNNILLQAGTAMLAQANQMPQSVLQLLR